MTVYYFVQFGTARSALMIYMENGFYVTWNWFEI
jgi:hypothetical protein